MIDEHDVYRRSLSRQALTDHRAALRLEREMGGDRAAWFAMWRGRLAEALRPENRGRGVLSGRSQADIDAELNERIAAHRK